LAEVGIESEESALLIIDMENDIVKEEGNAASFGVWKSAEESKIIQKTKKVLEKAKEKNIPVIYVRLAFRSDYADLKSSPSPLWKMAMEEEAFKEETWGSEIVSELKPESEDYVVKKRRISAFHDTDLETLLNGLDRNTLIVCGVATNFCVEGTVRAAADKDFYPVVLKDCTASVSEEAHQFPVEEIFPLLGAVTNSEKLIAEL